MKETLTIDARGMACPQPVLETKKVLDQALSSHFKVLVDNDAARENVSRFATSRGCQVSVHTQASGYHELTVTDRVRAAVAKGESEQAAFGRLRVWQTRQGPVRQAMGRLSADDFGDSFRALSLIDRQGKGRARGDVWETLDRLLWFLCDPRAAGPVCGENHR